MSEVPATAWPDLVPRPAGGRIFEAARRVRLAEIDVRGRLRLDAATRYLQDVSADDTADAALSGASGWVVRRTYLEVHEAPRYLEEVALSTWCSGIGSHYAERRVQAVGARGGRFEATTLWVNVDHETGRPRRVPPGFDELFGEAAAGRRATSRLHHPGPPPGRPGQAWPVRASDFDLLGHVNNAAYWEVVVEVLEAHADLRPPLRAEVEHRVAVEPGATVTYVVDDAAAPVRVWILADGALAASAAVAPLPG